MGSQPYKVPKRNVPYGEEERVEEQVRLLLQLLDSSYGEAHLSAIAQLSGLGELAVHPLVDALKRREGGYRETDRARHWPNIVTALGMIGSPKAVPALVKILAEEANDRSSRSLRFGHEGHREGSWMEDEAREGWQGVRMVFDALNKLDKEGALSAILKQLPSLDAPTAFAALSWFGDEGRVALMGALKGGDAARQRIAAEVLADHPESYNSVEGRAATVKLLKSPDASTQRAAVKALRAFGDPSAASHLLAFARSKRGPKPEEADLRKLAYESLGKLGDVALIPELLKDAGEGASIAESVIASFGKVAMPVLLDAVKTGKPGVKDAASRLILRIGGS